MTVLPPGRGFAVVYDELYRRAGVLLQAVGEIAQVGGRVVGATAASRIEALPVFGILGGEIVLARLALLADPAYPTSLACVCEQLTTLAGELAVAASDYAVADASVRAEAAMADVLVDAIDLVGHEVGVFRAVALVAAWRVDNCVPSPEVHAVLGPVLGLFDRYAVEGPVRVRDVSPADLQRAGVDVGSVPSPASGLDSALALVDALSSPAAPSTFALLQVGAHPPRYIAAFPGLQQPWRADASAADLPGAMATITGHSAYISGARQVLAGLPTGSQVLLVGHSQGGMVAEALASDVGLRRKGVTVAGVLTAGSPRLAQGPLPGTQYVALENAGDPIPRLDTMVALAPLLPRPRTAGYDVVKLPSHGAAGFPQHDLAYGGYLAAAGATTGPVGALRTRMSGFLTGRVLSVRYVQVSDGGPP